MSSQAAVSESELMAGVAPNVATVRRVIQEAYETYTYWAARRLLDDAGLPEARIFASGGLDEHQVETLVHAGAPVDAFGIGTQMGVSADAPFVDSVYKLVESDGGPVLKLSASKQTAPGRKQVWRGPEEDVLALRDEPPPADGYEPLLEPVRRAGARLGPSPSIDRMRERLDADLAALPAAAKRLSGARPVVARRSDALLALTEEARADALRRSGATPGAAPRTP